MVLIGVDAAFLPRLQFKSGEPEVLTSAAGVEAPAGEVHGRAADIFDDGVLIAFNSFDNPIEENICDDDLTGGPPLAVRWLWVVDSLTQRLVAVQWGPELAAQEY